MKLPSKQFSTASLLESMSAVKEEPPDDDEAMREEINRLKDSGAYLTRFDRCQKTIKNYLLSTTLPVLHFPSYLLVLLCVPTTQEY